MIHDITKIELMIMNAIIRYCEETNQSPSIRQISDDTGVSKTYTHEYLKSLRSRGYVNYQDGKDCTVTVSTHKDFQMKAIQSSLERAKARIGIADGS